MKKINIAIDSRSLAGPACGYSIYVESIIKCLKSEKFSITLVSNTMFDYKDHIGDNLLLEVFGKKSNLHWEQIDLPNHLSKKGYDLYFSGTNRGIPLRKVRGARYVLGLLDVIPYLFAKDYYLRRWKTLLRSPSSIGEIAAQLIAVARADAILTISDQSAIDIRRIFHRTDVTAHLIRLRDVERRPQAEPQRQFAYVGGTDARKRVDMLLRGFAVFLRAHPGYRLVLIGSNYASVAPLISELGLDAHVTLTGYVDHDAKFRILGESVAMVYPSLYEGYGMAIAEGFQAGIPVIAGQGGSQRQVGGEGIRRIDPLSPDEIAVAMAEMLDPAARVGWIRRGQAQLERLTDPAIETATAAFFAEQGRLARFSAS